MNPAYQQKLDLTEQAVHGARNGARNGTMYGELAQNIQAEIDAQAESNEQEVIDVAGVSAPMPPSPPRPRPTKASIPVVPAVQQEKGQPLSEKLENFKSEALKKLAVFAFWKTAQVKTATKKGSGIGDRLKDVVLAVVLDLPRWVGTILPLVIALPVLKEQILVLYACSFSSVVIGLIFDRKSLTRNGAIAFATLKIVEEFIKTFLP